MAKLAARFGVVGYGAWGQHPTATLTGTQGAVWVSRSGALDRIRHPTFFLKAFDGGNVEELSLTRSP